MKASPIVSMALVFVLLTLVGIPLAQNRPALAAGNSSWWNASWDYRKTITITELSGSTLTDYQIGLTVSYDSDMQPDFADIRFIDSDNTTELGHWRQSYTASSSAIFWVKVPSIPASGTKKIYMYYGNLAASSASSGAATFDFFDDFSGDLSSWTQERGTWAINGDGRVYCSADAHNHFNALVSSYTGSDYIAEADMIMGDVTAGVAIRYDKTSDYFYAAQANVEIDRLEVNKYKAWGDYSAELLTNPGAESGTSGWTASGDFTTGEKPTSGTTGPHSSSNCFFWDPSSASDDWAYQEVDLSPWLYAIEQGNAQIKARGWLVSSEYSADPVQDQSRLVVVFYDSLGGQIAAYDTGPQNLSCWAEFGVENYAVPTNAVKMRMWIQSYDTYEPDLDSGSIDDLTVKVRLYWEGLGSTSRSYTPGDSIQIRTKAAGWTIEGKDLTNNVTASGPDTEFTSGYAGLIANSGFATSPQFDNFRVRKYASPEPATSFSLEEVPLPLISGWGWCLAYKDVGDVTLDLAGSMIPRANAPEVVDLHLVGTLEFSIPGKTDTFELELLGTRVRSLFFLKQVEGGANPLIAEFEGFWLAENDYIACEGRLAITTPNHTAQPYAFVLRTGGVDVPLREPGGWVENIEFIIQKGVLALDIVGDRLAQGGAVIKDLLGTVLTQVAVIVREVRKLGAAYIP
jgi:hypothetical protein